MLASRPAALAWLLLWWLFPTGAFARSHPPATLARAASGLLYFGGPVTANARVYAIWWGKKANLRAFISASDGGMPNFYAGVTNSPYVDWLSEYSSRRSVNAGSAAGEGGTQQTIGRGNYAGSYELPLAPLGTVTDAVIAATLGAAFDGGTLPPPDGNSIYALHFPSSVTVDSLGKSCVDFSAYHEITPATADGAAYLVLPDCGQSPDAYFATSAHELAETLTDRIPTPGTHPDYPQAWNDSMGNEIGDLCTGRSVPLVQLATSMGTFSVQQLWDNRTQSCQAFSAEAQDFTVSFGNPVQELLPGHSSAVQVTTETVRGAPATLTLAVTAPPGISAKLSSQSLLSGSNTTLQVTLDSPSPRQGGQVVVTAFGVGGVTHSAALLVQAPSKPSSGGCSAGGAELGALWLVGTAFARSRRREFPTRPGKL